MKQQYKYNPSSVIKLRDATLIYMGYSFRRCLDINLNGNVHVIQAKDVSMNSIDFSRLDKVEINGLKSTHLLKESDILFKTRGETYSSSIIKNVSRDVVAAAPLLVVRVKDKRIIPEYLNWYFNHPKIQIKLSVMARGTSLKMINKLELENLEIVIPSIDIQKNIVEIATLSEKEHLLLKKIAEKKRELIDSILMKKAEGGK